MNKVLLATIVAAGLTVGTMPEAAAHTEVRGAQSGPAYEKRDRRAHSRDYYERNDYRSNRGRDYYQHKRVGKMPKWLKRKKSFRRWYKDSPITRYRFLSWNQLYDIYRWERSYFLYHRH